MNRLTLFVWLVCAALAGVLKAGAQPVTTIYSFMEGPANPRAGLTLGNDGNFYGTTEFGGGGEGALFKLTTNGVMTILVNFNGYGNGSLPVANLLLGPDGNFYGTTLDGGTNNITGTNASGTVFQVATNGTLTTLVNFNGVNGGIPLAGLALGPDGNFYGTTEFGGLSADGTVFKLTTDGTLTTLVNFNGTNGANPLAGLTAGPGGNLYGTTRFGGTNGNFGTVFAVTTNGVFNTLFYFGGTNGAAPYGAVTVGPDGNLYGTTSDGAYPNGAVDGGTVFELTTNGVLTTLVHLAGFLGPGSNGITPYAGLTLGPDGSFYGTTYAGGANGNGTVFKVSTNGTLATLVRAGIPFEIFFNSFGIELYSTNGGATLAEAFNGTLTTLHNFSALTNGFNPDGAQPQANLTLGPDGNFYGTAYGGGNHGFGTVFKVSTNGTFSTVASFTGNTGVNPESALTPGPDGSLYGTAKFGGIGGSGTLFKLTTSGVLTMLVNFDSPNEGANPQGGLIPGPGGNFYGTAVGGGTNLLNLGGNNFEVLSDGTVFELTTNGILTALAGFNGTNGANPFGSLAVGPDGNLYGTTAYGGISNGGTIFQIMTNGTLTTLTNFNGLNGANPQASLTLGPDGNFYGTCGAGGTNGNGTVFQVTTNGALTTLVYFNGTNGADPNGALLLGPDGNFYGTAYSGGARNDGTVFKLTTSGTLTTLVNFAQTNGEFPIAGLALGPDGNFYGTTELGGVSGNAGTVFKLATNGTLTTLYSFALVAFSATNANGTFPFGALTLQTNGNFIHFYGTTYNGGSGGAGTVFQLNLVTANAMAENSTNTFFPLTNEVVWTTGGVLGLVTAGATNGTAQVTGSGIVFTPRTNFTGTATINYTVTDHAGGTNHSLITVLVTNIPPVANPDFYSVAENSGANTLSPLVNDTPGTSGGMLKLIKVNPTNGTAVINGTNVLFTPSVNFTGTATIGYTITDQVGGTNTSLITLLVTNVAPMANPQSVTTAENTAQTITLAGNDPNHLPLTFTIVSGPGNGALSGLDTNTGVIVYTPGTNYIGPDSFTFLVNNGQTSSAPALISITITAAVVSNLPPVANPDQYAVTENTTNTLSPLANDIVQAPGGRLDIVSLSPTNGTAVISGANIIFTPLLNFLGTATIGYTITDNVGGTNSSLITITVTNSISVAITSPAPGQVVSNAAFTVTGTATASTVASVTNVYVQLNGGAWVGATTANDWTNWTANVTLTAGSNTASAYGVDAFGNLSPTNSVIFDDVTNAPVLADLSLSVSAAPEPVPTGSNLVYSITVSNAGPSAATGVVVSNQLPAGATLVSATGGATPANGVLLVSLGSLAGGATNSVQIVVQPTAAGQLTNTFQVFANELDPDLTNNTAIAVSTVTNLITVTNTSSAVAYATILASNASQQVTNYSTELIGRLPDGTVVYDQTFTNAFSDATVQAAVAQAAADLTNAGAASYTGPTETNSLQAVVGSSSVTITNDGADNFSFVTTGYLGPQTIQIGQLGTFERFTANGPYTGPTGGNPQPLVIASGAEDFDTLETDVVTNLVVTTTTDTNLNSSVFVMSGIVARADLSLSATAAPQPVIVGSNLVYTVSITNRGPSAATGVTVSNRIPANVTFVSATGGATPTGGVLLVNLGPLATNASMTAQITVQPTAAGNLTNVFQVFADQTDPVLTNNSATVVSTVTNAALLPVDVTLSLTAAPNPVGVGAPLTYSLTVTNNSSTTATGVVVSNILPANVTLISVLPSGGSVTNIAGVLTFNVGSLPNGNAATLAIVVVPEAPGLLTNSASAFSAQTDSQPANNRVQIVTTAVSTPVTNLVVTVLSAITLNPQTGLFEQRIQVSNGGPATPSSVLVLISGLAKNVVVYNASGTTNGLPYVQSASPLGVGSNLVFVLEYYVPTRVIPTNVVLTVVGGPPVIPPVITGTILSISREVVLSNGSVLVQFSAIPGRIYAIQYSSDLATWRTAVPVITAPANQVQWIDAGPPQTTSSPAQAGTRYYRVVLLPAR